MQNINKEKRCSDVSQEVRLNELKKQFWVKGEEAYVLGS